MVWLRIGDSLRKVIFSFSIFSGAVEVFGRQWLADKWQSRAIGHLIPSGQLASQDISYSSSSPLSFFWKPRKGNPQIEREGRLLNWLFRDYQMRLFLQEMSSDLKRLRSNPRRLCCIDVQWPWSSHEQNKEIPAAWNLAVYCFDCGGMGGCIVVMGRYMMLGLC